MERLGTPAASAASFLHCHMLTICVRGGPDPRPSALAFPRLSGEDEVPLHKSSGRLAARDGTFKKVPVLGRGTSRCCRSSQRQDGAGGGTAREAGRAARRPGFGGVGPGPLWETRVAAVG